MRMSKAKSNLRKESNPTVYNRIARRAKLRCAHCRPNRNENAKRRPKHGRTKPKKKNKRS